MSAALLSPLQYFTCLQDSQGASNVITIIAFPDFILPFWLYTDASMHRLSVILVKIQEGRERIICWNRCFINVSDTNYSATKQGCLTVKRAIWNFRHYLTCTLFQVITDKHFPSISMSYPTCPLHNRNEIRLLRKTVIANEPWESEWEESIQSLLRLFHLTRQQQ